MVLLRLSSTALSRSCFAISPLAETLGSMIVLGKDTVDPWLVPWHAHHHTGFVASLQADPFATGLVRLLSSTKWLPRFVAVPPPGGMRTTIDSELPLVAAVPDAEVGNQMEQSVAHS